MPSETTTSTLITLAASSLSALGLIYLLRSLCNDGGGRLQRRGSGWGSAQWGGGKVQTIIKLGGAAVTKKDVFEKLDTDSLLSCCVAVAAAAEEVKGRLVVIHGAGSFGHHSASASGISQGGLSTRREIEMADDYETLAGHMRASAGFTETRSSVLRLNGVLVSALQAAGVQAVGLSPLALGWNLGPSATEIQPPSVAQATILACIEHGLVPVIHGDCVFSKTQGCGILGGDILMEALCRTFRPECAAFLTNVNGVFDRPPTENGARLMRRLSADASTLRCTVHEKDVTGGILAKISSAVRIAAMGPSVRIANATATAHAIPACLPQPLPAEWVGTEIVS